MTRKMFFLGLKMCVPCKEKP